MALGVQPHHEARLRSQAHLERLAGLHPSQDRAVHLERRLAAAFRQRQLERLGGRDHSRPGDAGYRRHGGDDHGVEHRRHEWPSRRVRVRRGADRRGDHKRVAAVSPAGAPLHGQRCLQRSLAGHARKGDVVERDRLVASVCQHRRAVFLDGVVAHLETVECGVELVRLDLDEESEVPEVHAEDGDGARGDESQRAEHRAVAAETDQYVGLVEQLGLAHRLHVVW